MKYHLFLRERGEGCDYTIGCGMTLLDVEADSPQEAVMLAKVHYIESGHPESGHELTEMILFGEGAPMPVERWAEEWQAAMAREKKAAEEAAARAEFERLRGRF